MFEYYSSAKLPTMAGEFRIYTFKTDDESEHAVLVRGEVKGKEEVPLRIHSECVTGDVFGSKRCDCRDQLIRSLVFLGKQDYGMLIYLRQEGRGIGLLNKIKAYSLQDEGYDTVDANLRLGLPADNREYDFVINVLNYFKVKSIRLITNNPAKITYLEERGVTIEGVIPIKSSPTEFDEFYLETKKKKMGHLL